MNKIEKNRLKHAKNSVFDHFIEKIGTSHIDKL